LKLISLPRQRTYYMCRKENFLAAIWGYRSPFRWRRLTSTRRLGVRSAELDQLMVGAWATWCQEAAGMGIAPGLLIGVVGYDNREITGDSGSGDVLGPFKGRSDAIGPGLTYTSLIGTTPVVFNMRHYQEFNAHNRSEGNSTIFSGTIRY